MVPDYEGTLDDSIEEMKIGMPVNLGWDMSGDVVDVLDECSEVLAGLGGEIVEAALPDMDEISALANVILKAEASAVHAQWLRECPEKYSDTVRRRIDEGFHISAVN